MTAALLSVLLSVLPGPGVSRVVPDPDSDFTPKHQPSDVCSRCSGVLHTAHNMISGPETKLLVFEELRSLCLSLSSVRASQCHTQLNKHLSTTLLPQRHKPAESCELLGLCAEAKEVSPAAVAGSISEKEQFGPVCSLCVLVVKKLETLLPQNMTEEAIRALLADVCALMPQSYRDQCDEFVQKYGDEIVDFLMSSAAPHTICTLLHLCLLNGTPATHATPPSDCDSCRTLLVLSRLHLGLNRDLNQSESRTRTFLQSVCALHPQALPKCEVFTRVYSSELLTVLSTQRGSAEACETAGLCAPVSEASALGRRGCSWGPGYWCQNVQTAQECGNQAFCKKFVWK